MLHDASVPETSRTVSTAPGLRLTPVPSAEWDENTRSVLLRYLRRPELYLSGGPEAPPMPVVLELFANHLPLGDSFMGFTGMLAGADAELDAVHRELLILGVAWRTRSGYEWAQHARAAVEAGLTPEKVEAVPQWSASQAWTPTERALLAAVDDMVDRFAVSDATWGTSPPSSTRPNCWRCSSWSVAISVLPRS